MEDFAVMISAVVAVMKFEFMIWGFTLSFWQIFIYGLIVTVLLYLFWGFFDGK